MGRRWTWNATQDDRWAVELGDDGLRWELDTYDERAGASSQRAQLQSKDDFLGYGPIEPAPESIVRELAGALGLAHPPWLKPLDPRIETWLKAAAAGDIATLRASLASGLAVDAHDQRGYTAVWNAIARGRNEAALFLIDAGADVRRGYRYGETALHLAAKFGDGPLIQRLIASGADVNAIEGVNGETPLSAAIQKKRAPEIIRVLIDAGSDVDRARDDGSTLLIGAVHNGLLDAVKMLIAAHADVGRRDNEGLTALLHAAKWQSNPAFCDALLAAGADVAACDRSGSTALMLSAYKNYRDNVRRLLAAGADVNARAASGVTALMQAIYTGRPDRELLEQLLASGADIEARRDDGATALIIAAQVGSPTAIDVLLDHGADVAAVDAKQMTALMHATARHKTDVINLLKSRGAA
jgi:ankyrin repeat protein